MKVLQKEIIEIVRSCAEDESLRRVVLDLNNMKREEREMFSKKMEIYFSSKSSKIELQTYKFFKLLLKDEVRSLVMNLLKKELAKGS